MGEPVNPEAEKLVTVSGFTSRATPSNRRERPAAAHQAGGLLRMVTRERVSPIQAA